MQASDAPPIGGELMRSLTCAVRLAPLLAALLLGGCVTAETVSVDTTATAVPVATRGPDEPRDDLTLGKEHFRARHYGLAEMHFRRRSRAARTTPRPGSGSPLPMTSSSATGSPTA